MLANYHTHTARCGHASGEDRAYVEDAIRNGMQVLGFSDHCPWVYPDGYVSPIRMSLNQVDGYFTSLTNLRDEYARDITIYIGFEAEYYPELIEAQERLLADYPVDYLILGQHHTRREPYGSFTGAVVTDEAVLEGYVDMVIAGMETGKYIYAAHPDVMGFPDKAVYDKHYRRLCRWLSDHQSPVEINVHGIVEHRHYTDTHFLNLAAEAGCTAIIGCDAHIPARLDDRTAQAACETMAARAGLKLIDFLPGLEPKHL